jgi:hypothetical protein
MSTVSPSTQGVIVKTRKTSTSIWVTFDKVGFHCYPNAPEEVAYLRERHRHIFKFSVRISVEHDDREIEFHMFKNWLTSLYQGDLEIDYKSCEMLAEELIEQIIKKYDCHNRIVSVSVSEDGECGAVVESFPGDTFGVPSEMLEAAGYKREIKGGREEA